MSTTRRSGRRFSKLEELCFKVKKAEDKLQVTLADMAWKSSLRDVSCEQLDSNVTGSEEMQSHSEQREDEIFTLYDKKTRQTAKMTRLRTENANKTSEATELDSVADEEERPAKRAEVIHGVNSSLGAPSSAAYTALPVDCNDFENRCETLVPDYRCILGLDEEPSQLHAKVIESKKTNVKIQKSKTNKSMTALQCLKEF